MIIDTSSSPCS